MSYCTTLTGKHRYEPRFDEVPTGFSINPALFPPLDLRRLLLRNVYVCDVCRHCGDVIDRLGKECAPPPSAT